MKASTSRVLFVSIFFALFGCSADVMSGADPSADLARAETEGEANDRSPIVEAAASRNPRGEAELIFHVPQDREVPEGSTLDVSLRGYIAGEYSEPLKLKAAFDPGYDEHFDPDNPNDGHQDLTNAFIIHGVPDKQSGRIRQLKMGLYIHAERERLGIDVDERMIWNVGDGGSTQPDGYYDAGRREIGSLLAQEAPDASGFYFESYDRDGGLSGSYDLKVMFTGIDHADGFPTLWVETTFAKVDTDEDGVPIFRSAVIPAYIEAVVTGEVAGVPVEETFRILPGLGAMARKQPSGEFGWPQRSAE